MAGIKNTILNALAPIVELLVKEALKLGLKELFAKDFHNGAVVVASLYPVMDVPVENAVEKTETDIDDAAVDGIKAALEWASEEYDVPISNVDDD